jgi:hypothetical protein
MMINAKERDIRSNNNMIPHVDCAVTYTFARARTQSGGDGFTSDGAKTPQHRLCRRKYTSRHGTAYCARSHKIASVARARHGSCFWAHVDPVLQ